LEEAIAIGVDDYFNSGEWCFIEWPEKIEPLLPENYIQVSMKENQGLRTIYMQNQTSQSPSIS
jgi:tRNA threonylcarbamoyladenosine biosynthesis protein TsaE